MTAALITMYTAHVQCRVKHQSERQRHVIYQNRNNKKA